MSSIEIVPVIVATVGAIQLALIDIKQLRIPNRNLAVTTLFTLLAMFVAAMVGGDFARLSIALLGAGFSIFVFMLIHVVNPRGLGMGDVKFAGLLGLTMSWMAFPAALRGFIFAFASTAVFAFVAVLFKGFRRKTLIPFGPFLLLGLMIVELQIIL